MQIVIDIPDRIHYGIEKGITVNGSGASQIVLDAVKNGTPISDNATNGDVIKAMFDTTEEHFYDNDRMVDVYGLDRSDDPSTFYADWWNAPYKAESEE